MATPELFQIKVKSSDMDADYIKKVQETLLACMNEIKPNMKMETQISQYFKNDFDKFGGYGWNCIVGKNFGSHVIHQTKKYIFFQFTELSVLLWKA